jgi:hypothetical protein
MAVTVGPQLNVVESDMRLWSENRQQCRYPSLDYQSAELPLPKPGLSVGGADARAIIAPEDAAT